MDARRLPANHGVLWLIAGFSLFRRNPPLLTLLTFTYLLLVVALNLIPGIGPFLLPIALPALTAILGNGCRSLERSRTITGEDLILGLSERRTALGRLGGLHLVGSALLVLVSTAFGTQINIGDGLSEAEMQDLAVELMFLLVLAQPLLMAFWFAPLLTLWNGVPALKAVFFSFVASWRNWRAFAMYGLAVLIIGVFLPGLILVVSSLISSSLVTVISTVLRMLLMFILAPSLVASVYLSYRDVFQSVEPAVGQPLPVENA